MPYSKTDLTKYGFSRRIPKKPDGTGYCFFTLQNSTGTIIGSSSFWENISTSFQKSENEDARIFGNSFVPSTNKESEN